MPFISLASTPVKVKFFGNAKAVYGGALAPSTPDAVGLDLRACFHDGKKELIIAPGERETVLSGLAIEPLSPGIAGFVYSRSGLGAVKGIVVAQGVGVIDPDYRGEIRVILLNTSQQAYVVREGERVAQLAFQPYFRAAFIEAEELDETQRGAGGFGHTGKQ